MLRFNADGNTDARGLVYVPGGRSSIYLIGGAPAQSTCADTDGDGTGGITSLQLIGRNPRSGNEMLVSVIAGDSDLDQRGEYNVRLRAGDLSTDATLVFWPLPTGRGR